MNTWIPSIEVESAHGTREVALATKHFMNRRIFLQGEINAQMANDFLTQFLYLEQGTKEPVTIYINSPGGEVNAGLMIYDVIRSSSLPVYMICTGQAASMAAVLLAGGQPGRRFILKHSQVMIHEPLLSRGIGGSATSIQNISESIIKTRDLINGILVEHTGKTREEIDKATGFDHYMNAEEAVAFGLCDEVLTNIR